MRAVVERHSKSIEVPPLRVRVCKGEHDLSIKVTSFFHSICLSVCLP